MCRVAQLVRWSAASNSRLRCDQERHCEHGRSVQAISRCWFRREQLGRVVATRDERRYWYRSYAPYRANVESASTLFLSVRYRTLSINRLHSPPSGSVIYIFCGG